MRPHWHLSIVVLLCLTTAASAQTLLVGNKSDDTVDLIDLESGESMATLPTGVGPHEIAVSPDGRTAVVSNYGDRETPGASLTVVDVVERAVTGTIELGEHTRPHGLAWIDHERLAVTAEGSRHLLVVDPSSGEILLAVETAQEVSHMVAVSAELDRAFVANIGSGSVTVVDLAEGTKVVDLATGDGAEGIALSADGGEVWVTNRADDTVSVIDAKSLEIEASLECPGFPIRAALTGDGRLALVSSARSGEVVAFDVATRAEVARTTLDLAAIPDSQGRLFGDQFGDSPVPVGLVISPEGDTAWEAPTHDDVAVAIDPDTLEDEGMLDGGREPDGMAYSPH